MLKTYPNTPGEMIDPNAVTWPTPTDGGRARAAVDLANSMNIARSQNATSPMVPVQQRPDILRTGGIRQANPLATEAADNS